MARHRARSLRASATKAGALAVAATASVALIGVGAASATVSRVAVAKSSEVIGRCTFTVKSLNPSDATANTKLAAQAQPKTLDGYSTHAYTQVFCSVYDNHANLLATYNPFANGAVVQASSITPVLPYSPNYTVCARGYTKLNNGNESFTPTVCT